MKTRDNDELLWDVRDYISQIESPEYPSVTREEKDRDKRWLLVFRTLRTLLDNHDELEREVKLLRGDDGASTRLVDVISEFNNLVREQTETLTLLRAQKRTSPTTPDAEGFTNVTGADGGVTRSRVGPAPPGRLPRFEREEFLRVRLGYLAHLRDKEVSRRGLFESVNLDSAHLDILLARIVREDEERRLASKGGS